MKIKTSQTWLFAFTDLAFLLLISLSIIPSAPNDVVLHLAEMDVPSVPDNSNTVAVEAQDEVWELQVHAISDEHPVAYRMVRATGAVSGGAEPYAVHVAPEDLVDELTRLRYRGIRPMLLPEKTSLSQDFLFAAGAMARVWGGASSRSVVKTVDVDEGGS